MSTVWQSSRRCNLLIGSETYLTCQQAAKMMGVSRSTVQRYCDQGVLHLHRTLGGHRRIKAGDVENWLNSQGRRQHREHPPQHNVTAKTLLDHWINGRQYELDRFHEHMASSPQLANQLFESLLPNVLKDLNERYARRAISTAELKTTRLRIRHWLTRLNQSNAFLGPPEATTIGISLRNHESDIDSLMTSVAINHSGIESIYLGYQSNLAAVIQLCHSTMPNFLWCNYQTRPLDAKQVDNYVMANHELYRSVSESTRLVVMGEALDSMTRKRMKFDCFAESIEQLIRYVNRSQPLKHRDATPIKQPNFRMAQKSSDASPTKHV